MAGLLCKCGHNMGSSDDPSPYILDIYYENEIDDALANDENLQLHNFQMNWDEKHECRREYQKRAVPVSYWFCPECQRVYEVQHYVDRDKARIFKRVGNQTRLESYNSWVRIYVFPDVEVYAAKESYDWDFDRLSLAAYLREHPTPIYYISADETLVHALDSETGELLFAYILEATWPNRADLSE